MATKSVIASLPEHSVVVSISIRVDDLPSHAIVPQFDEKGATQAQPDVFISIPYAKGDKRITARIKGKSFRRIMLQLEQMHTKPEKIVLEGRLTSDGDLEGAGLTIRQAATAPMKLVSHENQAIVA